MLAESAGLMSTDEARAAMQRIVADARSFAEASARSGQAWFRALGTLPRRGEAQMRIRPSTLESGAWDATLPALRRFQDDLYALSQDLSLLSKVFHPEPGAEPPRVALDVPKHARALPSPSNHSTFQPFNHSTVARALARSASASADDPLAEMRVAAQAAEAARRLEIAEASVQGLLADVEFLSDASDPDWAYWVEMAPGRGGRAAAEAGLRAAPVEVAKWLAEGIFAKLDTVVLCSATMSVSGSTSYLAHRLGLDLLEPDRVAECRLGSPFDYARQCLAAVPAFLPPQAAGGDAEEGAAFIDAFGGLLARLAAIARGRTLALFTSYATMLAVAQRAAPDLRAAGIRLLVQGSGPSREALTADFRDETAGPAVLLGTDSFWEGVDLIGDALRCLVIAKLPFDPPDDPLVDARSERVEQGGGSAFRDYAVPNAVIRFRQGFGRLIRHRADRGVAILADTRLYTKGYGAIFRRNLPAELRRYDDEAALLADVAGFLGEA
jgi:Rad3-related DNA helicase